MHIFAHRGCSGTAPENTLAAFKQASQLPIYGVEFDVHLSKDGELVVIHDESIDRTSNGSGYVKDLTLAELRQFDFGQWFSQDFNGEVIPTLGDVLSLFLETNHVLNIELKSDIFPYEGMVEKVIALVRELNMTNRIIISSFDHEALLRVNEIDSSIPTGVLAMEVMIDMADYVKKIEADAAHIFFPAAFRQMGKDLIAKQIPVRVFTVNEQTYAKQLRTIGVESIFTDYPEIMLKLD